MKPERPLNTRVTLDRAPDEKWNWFRVGQLLLKWNKTQRSLLYKSYGSLVKNTQRRTLYSNLNLRNVIPLK